MRRTHGVHAELHYIWFEIAFYGISENESNSWTFWTCTKKGRAVKSSGAVGTDANIPPREEMFLTILRILLQGISTQVLPRDYMQNIVLPCIIADIDWKNLQQKLFLVYKNQKTRGIRRIFAKRTKRIFRQCTALKRNQQLVSMK